MTKLTPEEKINRAIKSINLHRKLNKILTKPKRQNKIPNIVGFLVVFGSVSGYVYKKKENYIFIRWFDRHVFGNDSVWAFNPLSDIIDKENKIVYFF